MIKFKRPNFANVMKRIEPSSIFTDKNYSIPLIESVPRNKDLDGILDLQLEEIEAKEA